MSEHFNPNPEREANPEDLVLALQEAAAVACASVGQANELLSRSDHGCDAWSDSPHYSRKYTTRITTSSELTVSTHFDEGMILDGTVSAAPLVYPVPEGVMTRLSGEVYTGPLRQELKVTSTGVSIGSSGGYRGPVPGTGYLEDTYDFTSPIPMVLRSYTPLSARNGESETSAVPMSELDPQVLRGLTSELTLMSQVIEGPSSSWQQKEDPRSGRLRFR